MSSWLRTSEKDKNARVSRFHPPPLFFFYFLLAIFIFVSSYDSYSSRSLKLRVNCNTYTPGSYQATRNCTLCLSSTRDGITTEASPGNYFKEKRLTACSYQSGTYKNKRASAPTREYARWLEYTRYQTTSQQNGIISTSFIFFSLPPQ